ncbi:MAG: hypothetical protein IKQ37_01405 [Bacteroidaceae bacterium]|nr:hypothetical protein [Bacteroidaceae bacterium]
MKRFLFITMALLAIVGRASAQESVTVNDITVPQGGEAFLEINYSLEGAGPYVGFMFLVDLPEGLSLAEDEENPGYPWYDEEVTAISRLSITTTPTGFAGTPKTATATINGNSGVLMRVKVAASSSLAEGSTHTGTIKELSFNVRDDNFNVTKITLSDVTFGITIGEAGSITLDENSATPIMDGSFDKLIMKRTFATGWNTLCLPFDVDDVEETFGEGAKAYKFTKHSNGDLTFAPETSLSAKTPYIIYMPAAITNDIVLEYIDIDESNTKSSYTAKNGAYFRGTYAPIAAGEWTKRQDTDDIYGVTPDGHIMKAGPEASIKGFRAYFDLPGGAEVKALCLEDDPDAIFTLLGETGGEAIYNVAGQRLNKKQKGVNITNGKKVVVK